MKQLVIFNLNPEEIKYAISEVDLSEFDGCYLNAMEDKEKEERMTSILFDEEGKDLLNYVPLSEIDMTQITSAVEIGFYL